MARADVQELYSEIMSTDFGVVPDGTADVEMIYGLVQRAYPTLCDDDFKCYENCASGNSDPEWHHTVRKALDALKRQNRRVSKHPERGYWTFGLVSLR